MDYQRHEREKRKSATQKASVLKPPLDNTPMPQEADDTLAAVLGPLYRRAYELQLQRAREAQQSINQHEIEEPPLLQKDGSEIKKEYNHAKTLSSPTPEEYHTQ